MSYAIIQLQGKQYRIAVGEQLTVDRLDAEEGSTLKITDVLLVNDNDKIFVGTPLVPKAVVELKVVGPTKGEKIRVFKYKSKSRYRKTRGHRQAQTVVSVVSIAA